MAKVLIIYTGGTFGMDEGQRLPKLSAPKLRKRMLQHVPGLSSLAHCDVEIAYNRDSSHIGPDDWIELSERIRAKWDRYDGVVILHGTDTLAYTASALSFLLRPCKKPVILTGAQKPLAALRTDARRNLVSAVEIAACGPRPLVNQVCIFFDDRLLQGNRAHKRSATEFEAFDSPKAAPLAMVGTSIRYRDEAPARSRFGGTLKPAFSHEVVMLHLTPSFPAALIEAGLLSDKSKVAGLVLVAFPSGTGPTHDPAFLHLLRTTRKRGIPAVVVSEGQSQVPTGSGVDPKNYESGEKMLAEGAIWAGEMTPECAFVKLSMILAQPLKTRDFAQLWRHDWASEGAPLT